MAKKKSSGDAKKTGASIVNRRARFDYAFEETLETGIVLVGSEVKSIFNGLVNLTDSFCKIENGELWMYEADIAPYEKSSVFAPDRRRKRKLLAHKKQIETFERKSLAKGFSIIPSKVYFNARGKVKVEVALGRGKKQYDKRAQIQEREQRRELDRELSRRR